MVWGQPVIQKFVVVVDVVIVVFWSKELFLVDPVVLVGEIQDNTSGYASLNFTSISPGYPVIVIWVPGLS